MRSRLTRKVGQQSRTLTRCWETRISELLSSVYIRYQFSLTTTVRTRVLSLAETRGKTTVERRGRPEDTNGKAPRPPPPALAAEATQRWAGLPLGWAPRTCHGLTGPHVPRVSAQSFHVNGGAAETHKIEVNLKFPLLLNL